MTLTIQEIMDFLPHRYPFLLIDRIVEFERAKRVVAIKNVTMNEPFFQGHFPGPPLMPGVLIVEAMAQAGAVLLLSEMEDRHSKLAVFTGIDGAKFRRSVTPGDQLRIEVDVVSFRPRAGKMEGKAFVDGKLACEATLTCMIVPRAPGIEAGIEGRSSFSRGSRSEHSSQRGHCRRRRAIPASCTIGPYCTIGPEVELGEECNLISHVVLDGRTRIGARNTFYPFGSIGVAPQDLKYKGEPTETVIGDGNTIRECVTISRGTAGGGGVTRLGSGNLLMAYVHIGHDSQVGSHCILANAATLAGHVTIEDHVTLGAFCPVHQHCTLGAHAFIGGGTIVTQDVLPFSLTSARRENKAFGINKIGLERRGFSPERIKTLQKAYRLLLAAKLNTTQAVEKMRGTRRRRRGPAGQIHRAQRARSDQVSDDPRPHRRQRPLPFPAARCGAGGGSLRRCRRHQGRDRPRDGPSRRGRLRPSPSIGSRSASFRG